MAPLPVENLVQAMPSQQLHQLALLIGLHAGEGHTVQHDSLDERLIRLL